MSHGYSGRQPAYTARCRNVSHTSRCMNSIQFSSSSLCFRSAIFLRQINLHKGTNFLKKTACYLKLFRETTNILRETSFFDYNKRRNKTKSPVPSLNNINNSLLHFSELLNYNLLAVLDADALGNGNGEVSGILNNQLTVFHTAKLDCTHLNFR